MKHVIAILGTLMLGAWWILPLFFLIAIPELGMIYFPLTILSICWGSVLNNWYGKNY